MVTAALWSHRSLCRRASVGCVITSYDDRQIHSFGYNGPAKHIEHHNCRGTPSMCQCLHAEENAIIRLRNGCLGSMNIYTTTFPCYMCAQRIIQAETITRLFYWMNYRRESESRKILHDADIDIVPIEIANFTFSYESNEE